MFHLKVSFLQVKGQGHMGLKSVPGQLLIDFSMYMAKMLHFFPFDNMKTLQKMLNTLDTTHPKF